MGCSCVESELAGDDGQRVGRSVEHVSQRLQRHQQLGGDLVAPALHRVVGPGAEIGVRQRRLTQPHVAQLVGEREDLRRLGISR